MLVYVFLSGASEAKLVLSSTYYRAQTRDNMQNRTVVGGFLSAVLDLADKPLTLADQRSYGTRRTKTR